MKWMGKYKQAYTSILTTVNTPNILFSFFFKQNFSKTHFQEEPLPLVFSKVPYFYG